MNAVQNPNRLLPQREVADLTGMSTSWLEMCRHRKTGIPYIKLGRSVRYRAKDVMDWVEAHAVSMAR
jgi:predicted DNA-binding transcriptional regulator AlpA